MRIWKWNGRNDLGMDLIVWVVQFPSLSLQLRQSGIWKVIRGTPHFKGGRNWTQVYP